MLKSFVKLVISASGLLFPCWAQQPLIAAQVNTGYSDNYLQSEDKQASAVVQTALTLNAGIQWRSFNAGLHGQLSEIDYKENKHLLRKIDRRVRYLSKLLESVKVVDYAPEQEGRVFFGAQVEIENEQEETLSFRIVGPDEIYGRSDYISIDSPMARAILKKQVDDEFEVATPTGKKTWYVNRIEYPAKPK